VVSKGVPKEIEGKYRNCDGRAGEGHQPPRGFERRYKYPTQHVAPAGVGWGYSQSQKAQGRGTINAIKLRLAPFRLVGMATLFTGIGLALAPIVQVLRWQSNRLSNILF